MRIARVRGVEGVFYGVVEGEDVRAIDGDPFDGFEVTRERVPLERVKLLAPVQPPNIIAIGLNYAGHVKESGGEVPERPVIFLKATTSLLGPGEPVVLPRVAPDAVDYEAELAVVIGRRARNVGEDEARDCILGYTCGNDVSARDCQLTIDKQWARGKSFDTFCPLGPWIETELDPTGAPIMSRLNGETMQDSNTSDMIFSAAELVSYCSQNMTLLPGTVIMTGTPEGVGFARSTPVFLREGDVIEVEIGGIGGLQNRVIREE